MTAEIAVMNKLAVALAADSAVTIDTPEGQKIYNTVNKLFALSKFQPVGIMIYGAADLVHVPWESIIKAYRQALHSRSFPRLADYARDFVAFVEKQKELFPREQQTRFVRRTVMLQLLKLRQAIEKGAEDLISAVGHASAKDLQEIAGAVIEGAHEAGAGWGPLRKLPRTFSARLRKLYSRTIRAAINEVFGKLPLTPSMTRRLADFGLNLLSRERNLEEDSGVVLAGFGRDDHFPGVIHLRAQGVAADRLIYSEVDTDQIDHSMTASIMPFARSEVVESFMEGVDPGCRRFTRQYLKEIFDKYHEQVFDAFPDLPQSVRKRIARTLAARGEQVQRDFLQASKDYSKTHHVDPITEAVEYLPKDELASMAESLVHLTSLKMRISMKAETVGGPIDVAVISKGDGFIWIKRKHYFSTDINPYFMATYYKKE